MDSTARARRIAELFDQAADLPPAERESLLDDACGGDRALRAEVEALLAFHDEPAGADTSGLLPPLFADIPGDSLLGQQIGPYRVLHLIAEGGMGAVYRAERADVGMQVALKLVRHGRLASSEQRQRFLLERRVLARLEHPHIARLLDAGVTEEQLPYLVMEYVPGEPVTRYCDRHRLSVEQRLRIFLEVCAAVHFAHRNLVVHRDLKPSNILVDKDGRAKLLDFGVAKLLEQEAGGDALLTRLGGAPLTPEYASPEQVRGEPVTTASDVYALGVVLYELLTGHRPYQVSSHSAAEVERVVCSTDPTRPSAAVMRTEAVHHSDGSTDRITPAAVSQARQTQPERLSRRLGGDLDTILLKALAKEPERRYASAQALAEDIERHLNGMPVRARADTLSYRAGKFVRRHRGGVAAAAAVCMALVAGLAAALWQSREAGRQRDLAVGVASTMVFDLADGLNRMVGPTESRLGLLNRAVEVFERIDGAGAATAEQQRQSANAYRRLAQTYLLLGETGRALHFVARAETIARRLAGRPGAGIDDRVILATVLLDRGDVLAQDGEEHDALASYDEALALARHVEQQPGAFPGLHRTLYLLLSRKADRHYYTGNLDSASVLYEQGFALAERLVRHDEANPEYLRFQGTILDRIADVLYYSGKVDESCVRYREVLGMRERAVALVPDDVAALRSHSLALQNVGWCSEQEGNTAEAVRLYGEGIAIQRRIFGNDPSNILAATNLMGGLGELAKTLHTHGEPAEAERHYREALGIGEAFRARGVVEPRVGLKTAQISQIFAETLIELRRPADAERVLGQAHALLEELIRREPTNQEYPRNLAEGLLVRGELQRRSAAGALAHLAEALRVYRGVAEATHMSTDWQKVALAQLRYGRALREAGQPARARQALLDGRRILLDLRAAGRLSDTSEGYREHLPQIERELRQLRG